MESEGSLTGPTSGHDGESGPPKDLKEIVGTRYPIKTVSIRNGALAASLRSQRSEVQVCQEVGVFSELIKRLAIAA